MAGKIRWAGGKDLIPAQAVLCLVISAAPVEAWGFSANFAPSSYLGSADPNLVWEMLIGGIVVGSSVAAVALWAQSAVRKFKRSQLRRNAFVSSALNNLSHGVVMTDAQRRIVYFNDRYLEIYGLKRSNIPRHMTGPTLLEWGRSKGLVDASKSVEEF